MKRKLLSILLLAVFMLSAGALQAQEKKNRYGGRIEWFESLVSEDKGGVEGTVVNRSGRVPVAEAVMELYRGDKLIAKGYSAEDGYFIFDNLPNGSYRLAVSAPGFVGTDVNVSVEGYVKDLIFVSLVSNSMVPDFDESSFVEFDMQDSGYEDSPSLLYGNDVYSNIAGYGFSAIRFKNRGYASESQDVYLSGVRMNDALTGYTPWSLWSGLNEAMRSKETTMGTETYEYGFGGYNGVTNILANPSNVRKGWRFSVLTNSALYRLRLMASYASGELDNGWSYAFNVSARLGGNDWVQGIYYRSFAYYAGVEKKFGDMHRLSLVAFASPGQRGAQNASTQEVYDLVGDNMYNSNWGYQNGKLRNARVRKTHEPVFILKYTANPLDNLEAVATVTYRTGKNGYTALDWYDAQDPRPDYYRYLPSYYYNENDDYGRLDQEKADFAEQAWLNNINSTRHINWDHLYNVNYHNVDDGGIYSRSKYIIEERRTDQNDLNLNASVKWRAKDWVTLTGGINYRWNRTEYYKVVDDLLGGDYYVNIDQFAERDFASTPAMIQNDLDYYFSHNNQAQTLYKGDKYGYDYYANVRNAGIWANASFEKGAFRGYAALEAGYSKFWRDGRVRKGLFAGLKDNGEPYIVTNASGEQVSLTSYDKDGNVITSKGRSDVADFFTYSAKLGASWFFTGGHRVYADVAYLNDAPTFNQSFVSPRTRNTLVPNLTTTKTFSADLNYTYSNNGYDIRVTGFWTKIMDQTDMMSFYDDSQNSFTNFAMTGIDQRHMGIEVGFKIPLFIQNLALQGVLSWGEYIYTSTPYMTQTVDNSADIIIDNQPVTYWRSNPVYKKTVVDGITMYETDANGNYIVEKEQKHYVPSTPQLAIDLGLKYRTNSYWFFEVNGQFFANSYLDMNPLYRTMTAVAGPDNAMTAAAMEEHGRTWFLSESMKDQMGLAPEEIEYMAAQEKFDPAFLLNASIGKSWYIDRKYNFGFSLEVKNILNNRGVKTGGYEQTRLIDSESGERYYRFDPKYFYMCGVNYMLNLYFRF